MSILDRKTKKYSTSDLFWEPTAAPTDGVVGDVNTMKLDPSHLGMGLDVIIDTSGVLRSRGSFTSITSDTFTSQAITGVAQTSKGTVYTASSASSVFLYGTSAIALTGFAKLTATGYTTVAAQELGSSGFVHNFAKLPNENGAVLCAQPPYPGQPISQTFLWGGNTTVVSDTSAGTAASTQGSKAIAGVGTAWTTALINTYLFINNAYVGQVDQVTSTTAITLRKGALTTAAAAVPIFKCARPIQHSVYKGRITATTGSAIVVGANTKFQNSAPAGGGSAYLTSANVGLVFRAFDGAYIGTVTSVQNDTTLTLTANAAIAMTNEEYYICPIGMIIGSNLGLHVFYASCVESFADRYWYGGVCASDPAISTPGNINSAQLPLTGSNSIAFSKKGDPECLDLDPAAGDILKLPTGANSDSIRGLRAVQGGLLVFRTYDTYLITGYSPETFRAVKILDDGIFNCLTHRPYKEGVIWAGPKGLWYFNGSSVINLLSNKLSRFYQRSSKNIQQGLTPGMAVTNDHVLFSYPFDTLGNRQFPYKNTNRTMVNVTLVVNMLNGAVSFFTNLFVSTDFSPAPLTTTTSSISSIVSRSTSGFGGNSFMLDGTKVFYDSSTAADNFDAVTGAVTFSSGAAIGPDVQFETIRLSLGNAARLKFWKMVLFNYSSDVGMTASFISTNDTTQDFPEIASGTAGIVTLPISSNVGVLKRIKFLVRCPSLIIRVYQTNTASATSQRFKLFWYTVGGKWMRQGRQQ